MMVHHTPLRGEALRSQHDAFGRTPLSESVTSEEAIKFKN